MKGCKSILFNGKQPVKGLHGIYFCPTCKGSIRQNQDECNYCFRCGQKILWKSIGGIRCEEIDGVCRILERLKEKGFTVKNIDFIHPYNEVPNISLWDRFELGNTVFIKAELIKNRQ